MSASSSCDFLAPSSSLFSPKFRSPSSCKMAASLVGNVFVTAIRVSEDSPRLAFVRATPMRSFTCAKFDDISSNRVIADSGLIVRSLLPTARVCDRVERRSSHGFPKCRYQRHVSQPPTFQAGLWPTSLDPAHVFAPKLKPRDFLKQIPDTSADSLHNNPHKWMVQRWHLCLAHLEIASTRPFDR